MSTERVSARTATTKTFDNPDGTQTQKVFSSPVHMRDATGNWIDIDPTLAAGGGRLHAKATPVGVDLAQSATDPVLARLTLDPNHSLSFGLAGAQAATVSTTGSDIAYSGILPGVTLNLEAQAGGVKEDLVLSSPSAPDTYVFPITMKGLSPAVNPQSGDVVYTDASGTEQARTARGFMQDSFTAEHYHEGAISTGVTYTVISWGGQSALALQLDWAWLNDPARVWPVVVDPSSSWNSTTWEDDTYVMSNFTADHASETQLKVGTYDGGTHTGRSYLNFDVSGLNGATILGATFYLWEDWSWSCSPRGMGVYRVTQPWGGHTMTGWAGASYADEVAWANFAMGYSASCPAGLAYWDISPTVRNWTSGAWGQYGLMLKADNEADTYAWKTYKSWNYTGGGSYTPVIIITYDWPPSMAAPSAPANGSVAYTTSPTLSASASDRDGDQVQYYYRIALGADAETSVVYNSGWTTASSLAVPAGVLGWATTYYWHVYTYDGTTVTGPNWVWWLRTDSRLRSRAWSARATGRRCTTSPPASRRRPATPTATRCSTTSASPSARTPRLLPATLIEDAGDIFGEHVGNTSPTFLRVIG